jgi:two-component system, chemotaxis family, protein-glutamate methylesterase/glutaminase
MKKQLDKGDRIRLLHFLSHAMLVSEILTVIISTIVSLRNSLTMNTKADAPVHHSAKAAFDIVAMAASAGGLSALSQVLAGLPADFPAVIVVVQHLDPRHRSLMATILSRRTPLQVKQAEEGEHVATATVYIAPPNRHLLVNPDSTLSLSQSELVHFVRPSADLLFESVAASYRERAIAVVLTGTGSDGVMGVQAIKKMGGTVIAQDETTAEFFGMPSAAIQTGSVDFVLPLDEIPTALIALVVKGAAE